MARTRVAGVVRCPKKQFRCNTTRGPRCLPNSWKCDHTDDCDDGFDEADCERMVSISNLTTTNQTAPLSTQAPPIIQPQTTTLPPLTTTHSTTTSLTTSFPSTTSPQTKTRETTATGAQTEAATYNKTNEDIFHNRLSQTFRRSDSTYLKGNMDTGRNETYVKSVQALDQSLLPYYVIGSLAFVVIALIVVVFIVSCKNKQKKRRRGRLPPIPPPERHRLISGSSSGTTITSSATSQSYCASQHSNEYEDIDKYRHPVTILAQTSTHSWDTDCAESNCDDNRYIETKWGDVNARRNSSYAAVLQFNNGYPSALTNFYEQPQTCQEQLEIHNEYLSIQDVSVPESACSGYKSTTSKITDEEAKGNECDLYNERENNYYSLQDESVLENVCTGYEVPISKLSVEEGNGKMTEFRSMHEVTITEGVSDAYEEPVNKAFYKQDITNIPDTCDNYNVSPPLLLRSTQCSIGLTSAQSDERDGDYLNPINDDYIHPI